MCAALSTLPATVVAQLADLLGVSDSLSVLLTCRGLYQTRHDFFQTQTCLVLPQEAYRRLHLTYGGSELDFVDSFGRKNLEIESVVPVRV